MSIANDKLVNLQDAQVLYNDLRGRINNKINSSEKGSASGVAELDSNGKVPSSQLPSYVDDVEEYDAKDFSAWNEWVGGTSYAVGDRVKITDNGTVTGHICKTATSSSTFVPAEWDEATKFPTTGESGKVYIADDTNITYRWSGSSYVPIGSDLALGETASTAYRGDRGKAAYDAAVVNPDSTPTQNSDNLVKSGGVYTAIQQHMPSDMTGASSSAAGTHGLVPAPAAGDQDKVLHADGTWKYVQGGTGGGARVLSVTGTITNTSGSYSGTFSNGSITADMKAIQLLLGSPDVFDANVIVTCYDGYLTIACSAVAGTSTFEVMLLKSVLNSTEFDILDAAKVDIDQGVENAGKALGIGNDGKVTPVEFSGTDFTGATASTAGVHGYVPAPAAGDQSKVLMGNGNWEVAPGARLIEVSTTVTNTSGSYSSTVQDENVTADMKAIKLEIGTPSVFDDTITITTGAGELTIGCNSVAGTSTLKITLMKQAQSPATITSTEFDVLNNRLLAVENVYTDTPVTIATTDWTLSSGTYTYTWTSSLINSGCGVEVFLQDGAESAGIEYFDYNKVSGGVQFTTDEQPAGDLPIVIRVINTKADTIESLTGADIATNVITGQTNVDGALGALDNGKVNTADFYATEMPMSNSDSTKVSTAIAKKINYEAIGLSNGVEKTFTFSGTSIFLILVSRVGVSSTTAEGIYIGGSGTVNAHITAIGNAPSNLTISIDKQTVTMQSSTSNMYAIILYSVVS